MQLQPLSDFVKIIEASSSCVRWFLSRGQRSSANMAQALAEISLLANTNDLRFADSEILTRHQWMA